MCFARVDMAGKVIIGGDGERWSGVVLYPGSVLGGGTSGAGGAASQHGQDATGARWVSFSPAQSTARDPCTVGFQPHRATPLGDCTQTHGRRIGTCSKQIC